MNSSVTLMSAAAERTQKRRPFNQSLARVLVAHLLRVILLVASLAIAARCVSKEEFGIFVLFSVAADFLIMASDFGIRTTTIRVLSADKNTQKEVTSSVLGFMLIISLMFSILVYLFGGIAWETFNFSRLQGFLPFLVLLYFVKFQLTGLFSFLQGLHLYNRFASIQVIEAVGRFILILLLVGHFDMELKGLVIAVIGSTMFSAILGYVSIPWFLIPRIDLKVLKKLLLFGFPLQIHGFMGFVFERTDTIMLGAMLGPLSVASYEVGYKVPNQVRGIFAAVGSVFFPQIAEYYGQKDTAAAEGFLKSTLRIISFLSAGATLVAILFSKEIISLLFSVKYAESDAILSILMVAICFGITNYFMGMALVASGRSKAILLTSIPESFINIVANLLFIPIWGVIGAAFASLMSRCAVNPVFLILLGLRNIKSNSLSYLKAFMCLGVVAIIFWLLKPLGVFGKSVIVGIYILMSFAVGSIMISDVKQTIHMLFKR